MNHLWCLKKGVMKDLLNSYEEPKPATTTIATLLKRMQDKAFIDYNLIGRTREYYPLISKKDYFSKHVNGLIKKFLMTVLSICIFFSQRKLTYQRQNH